MTFYDVYISSSKLSGEAHGMGNLITAMQTFEDNIAEGNWRNGHMCSQCKQSGKYQGGPDSLYHMFRVRQDLALKIVEAVDFKWYKQLGLKKKEPVEWLRQLVDSGEELWFNVDFYEL